eukprot:scaffold78573_cov55-Attheya_sp.AAC.4
MIPTRCFDLPNLVHQWVEQFQEQREHKCAAVTRINQQDLWFGSVRVSVSDQAGPEAIFEK